MTEELAIRQDNGHAIQSRDEMSVETLLAQVNKVQHVMQQVMKSGEHYGTIPGCGDKPTLLKPGAEKLAFTFRLAPRFTIERLDFGDGHREFIVSCELFHITTGEFVGTGVGSCSTMEAKFRFRSEDTGAPVPSEYWKTRDSGLLGGPQYHPRKKDGKWTIFERVEHDNPADYYNTILKMAKKRANVDAILTATAASDIFTQDIEDLKDNGVIDAGATPQPKPQPRPVQQPQRKAAPAAQAPSSGDKEDSRTELARLCDEIANAGMMVATQDYKSFALVQSDLSTGDDVCSTLSSFIGRDNSVVPGRTAMDLSDKAVSVTLKKAREMHALLPDAADEALDHALNEDDNPGPKYGPTQKCICDSEGHKFDYSMVIVVEDEVLGRMEVCPTCHLKHGFDNPKFHAI